MEYREELIVQLLENFYHATGIEASFIDPHFNALSRPSMEQAYEDLLFLSRNKLEAILTGLFEENPPPGTAVLYWFFRQ